MAVGLEPLLAGQLLLQGACTGLVMASLPALAAAGTSSSPWHGSKHGQPQRALLGSWTLSRGVPVPLVSADEESPEEDGAPGLLFKMTAYFMFLIWQGGGFLQ